MKICSTCNIKKELFEFSPDKRKIGGKNSQCRRCQLDFKKQKRLTHKIKAIEFLGGKCIMCGIKSDCNDIYDFHHRDPKIKEFSLNYLMNTDWNQIETELNKCDLLCSNCHKITHWKIRNNIV